MQTTAPPLTQGRQLARPHRNCLLSEVCHALGDKARAGSAVREPSRHFTTNALTSGSRSILRASSATLAMLATTMEHWDDAEQQFQYALAMNVHEGRCEGQH